MVAFPALPSGFSYVGDSSDDTVDTFKPGESVYGDAIGFIDENDTIVVLTESSDTTTYTLGVGMAWRYSDDKGATFSDVTFTDPSGLLAANGITASNSVSVAYHSSGYVFSWGAGNRVFAMSWNPSTKALEVVDVESAGYTFNTAYPNPIIVEDGTTLYLVTHMRDFATTDDWRLGTNPFDTGTETFGTGKPFSADSDIENNDDWPLLVSNDWKNPQVADITSLADNTIVGYLCGFDNGDVYPVRWDSSLSEFNIDTAEVSLAGAGVVDAYNIAFWYDEIADRWYWIGLAYTGTSITFRESSSGTFSTMTWSTVCTYNFGADDFTNFREVRAAVNVDARTVYLSGRGDNSVTSGDDMRIGTWDIDNPSTQPVFEWVGFTSANWAQVNGGTIVPGWFQNDGSTLFVNYVARSVDQLDHFYVAARVIETAAAGGGFGMVPI